MNATRKAKKADESKVVPLRPARPCPICGNSSARANYPFCSKRCADVDLNHWLSGSYAIPATEEGLSSDPETGGEDKW
jgi:uncharacterized protein